MQASSAADPGVGTHAIPDHVPRELVRPFDFRTGLGPYPHESVAALHSGPRVFFSPTHHNAIPGPGTWVLTRAEDIRGALQDAMTFSSNVRRSNSGLSLIPLELDPPEHPKFRAIMNPIFSPVRMKQLESKVRGLAQDLVAKVADKGGCDFVEDFAKPFPVGIFLDLMGLPQESMGRFLAWEARIMRDKQTRTDAIQEVAAYLQELISARRRNPTDDLITFAVKAQVDERPLADAEIIGICVLLFTDQEALRKDAALIPSAVEELFRAYAVVNTNRYTTRDAEFAGVTMKRGDNVTCSTILASRDPREFPNPNEVIFSRNPNLHNAFSYGPHRCLGSHLARREITAGIEEWMRSVPPFRVKPGAQITAHGGGVFSLDSLPLVW
jgi:cytochrome P450